MKRCLLLVAFFTIVGSLPGGAMSQSVGVSTVFAAPNTPPSPTPEVAPPPDEGASATTAGRPDKPAEESPLDCTTSPFGSMLMVGGEKEFFIGYTSYYNSVDSNLLEYRRFDRTAANELVSQQSFAGNTFEASTRFTKVWGTRTVVADLNGDGNNEYIQAMRDGNNNYSLITSTRSGSPMISDTWLGNTGTFVGNGHFAAASGNFLNQVNSTTQQVAIASTTSYHSIRVNI